MDTPLRPNDKQLLHDERRQMVAELETKNRSGQHSHSVYHFSKRGIVLHLVATKCFPVLLYGLEVCPLTRAELYSIDLAVTRFLMKLFNTSIVLLL